MLVCLSASPVFAGSTTALMQSQCAGCHDFTGPAPQTLDALWARQGPDLFYAGSKYRRAWVAEWLQEPRRIRPAGEFYRQHIRPGEKRDEIDVASLRDHPRLNKQDAEAVADALSKLRIPGDLSGQETLDPSLAPGSFGELLFDKIYGCMACHEIEPGYGGLSGPELYTAGRRLQAGFMLSYIKNPQAWDPKIWMPNKHVSVEHAQKLVNYLMDLSKVDWDAAP